MSYKTLVTIVRVLAQSATNRPREDLDRLDPLTALRTD